MKETGKPQEGWNGNQYERQTPRRASVGGRREIHEQKGNGVSPKPDRDYDVSPYEEYEWDEEQEEENGEPDGQSKKKSPVSLLTAIQIIGCCTVLAAAILLKAAGGKLFSDCRSWYLSAYGDSIIAQERMDQAKRTVIGLWTTISSAGPQQTVSSQSAQGAGSSQAASSGTQASSVSSDAAQSSAAAGSSPGSALKGEAYSP